MLPDRTQQKIVYCMVEFLTITRHDCIFTKCTFSWNVLVTSYKQDYYQGHSRTPE